MMIEAGGFDWKVHSTTMYTAGSRVGLSVVPSNIHIMHKMDEAKPDENIAAEVKE